MMEPLQLILLSPPVESTFQDLTPAPGAELISLNQSQ